MAVQGVQKTILVVEDVAEERKLLGNILADAGFRVIPAKDGAEARDIYRGHESEIDLVLCDVALPELGGWTTYLSLKEMNPDVRMILTSGYLDEKVKSVFVSGGVKDFVAKPYLAETILTSVKQALS